MFHSAHGSALLIDSLPARLESNVVPVTLIGTIKVVPVFVAFIFRNFLPTKFAIQVAVVFLVRCSRSLCRKLRDSRVNHSSISPFAPPVSLLAPHWAVIPATNKPKRGVGSDCLLRKFFATTTEFRVVTCLAPRPLLSFHGWPPRSRRTRINSVSIGAQTAAMSVRENFMPDTLHRHPG
jgi:hypothetical protein